MDSSVLYKISTLKDLYKRFKVIEIDSIMLGDLVREDSPIQKVTIPNEEKYFRVGVEATKYQGETYGIPHWLCTNFIVSTDE